MSCLILGEVYLGAMSPGPDFVIVSKNALAHSRRAGFFTAFGICMGILLHSAYCILGLAVIISQSLLLFSIIRYLGAAYLIYLGIKNLLSKNTIAMEQHYQKSTLSNWQAFREGFLVNLLNPKVIIFILSIFTIVIKPHTAYGAKIIYGLELSVISTAWFCFLTIVLTHKKVKQRIIKVQHIVIKVMGVFLVALGLDLLFTAHK